ncbi:MAG: TonB-dependent receptor [Gammaproteobacteria bacterium]|nr:TonB-dependent receptor [Gammaproteobacteria bacterium]
MPFVAWSAPTETAIPQEGQQKANDVIDQIIVVAHKGARSARKIAANVTVISRETLGAELAVSVSDVFRYAPGIDAESSGTRFGTEGINIRGIGGNRVALLVDGVLLSDQFDVGSFANATRDFINAGFIQQLEVLHGPASALYGSSAIGGVVAIRTPDPADLTGRNGRGANLVTNWRGADSSWHGTGMFALGDESRGLLFGGSLRNGSEFDPAAVAENTDLREYQRRSALVKFVADDAFGNTWRASVMHQNSKVQSDLNSMLGSGRFRGTTALEGDDEFQMDIVSLVYEFGAPGDWVDSGLVRGFYEVADVAQDTFDERALARRPVAIDRFFGFEQKLQGIELNLQKNLQGPNVSHRIGFGLEYRERRTEEIRDGLETDLGTGLQTNVMLGEVFPLRDFPISRSQEWGAYIEDAVSVSDWTLIAALRIDRYGLNPSNDPVYREDFPFSDVVSISETDLSPKLGLVYRLTAGTDVYAQYSHGFRAPPYEDANIGLDIPLFNVRAIPNPNLRSENSDGFDLGIRWQGLNNSLRLSAFRTRYTDFIETKVRLGADPVTGRILFQSQNISETLIEGIEAGWHIRLAGAFENYSLDGSLYKARGENRDNGEALNSVGPGQAVIGVNWSSGDGRRQLRVKSTLTERWSDRDESRGELFTPAGYTVFDLFVSQRLTERTVLRAGVLNVTDRTYWVWSDVRGLSPGDPMIPNLSRPGRSLTVGLDMNW